MGRKMANKYDDCGPACFGVADAVVDKLFRRFFSLKLVPKETRGRGGGWAKKMTSFYGVLHTKQPSLMDY